MIRESPFRFFLVVSPAPWWMLAALGIAVATGAATLYQDPREVDSGLALVLLLQMFAAVVFALDRETIATLAARDAGGERRLTADLLIAAFDAARGTG